MDGLIEVKTTGGIERRVLAAILRLYRFLERVDTLRTLECFWILLCNCRLPCRSNQRFKGTDNILSQLSAFVTTDTVHKSTEQTQTQTRKKWLPESILEIIEICALSALQRCLVQQPRVVEVAICGRFLGDNVATQS